MEDADAAAPDDQGNGDGAEELDGRVVERVGEDGVLEGDHVLAVDGFEVLKARCSRLKSCTTDMPLTCSWVKLLMRAMAARMRR